MGSPRISEDDRLIPEDLLYGGMAGEWVRVSAYTEGHMVSKAGDTAVCGAPLIYDEMWWERFQAQLRVVSGYDNRAKGSTKWSPTEFYIARDTRKGSKCAACKKEDLFEADNDAPVISPHPSSSALMSPFAPSTPADRLEHTRFLSQVARVAKELGATVVDTTSAAA